MQFGKLLLAASEVVLENESYDLLVGTQFFCKYNGIINTKDGYLSILGYEVSLIFEEPIKVPGKDHKTCVLEYPSVIFTLMYFIHSSNIKCPPPACPAPEGAPLLMATMVSLTPWYSTKCRVPGSQVPHM
ncbi:hypothetical protein DSO57_1007206 [Entomophthora muscae]|uniref:Uncharacterized protein n=1 Tax=Entomophthora muscae TaxID=34485 RepID=A0ACC2TJC6_9FUNG|nr:hypothetical protein DSO57_1007206 [Entomophthora muscae]